MSGFGPPFLTSTSTSFFDLVSTVRPESLPAVQGATTSLTPEGTTVLAFRTGSGVLMAGDRRATAGHHIASRRIEKVHRADARSVIGIAGTAGVALELIRLFQVELEHYEKIEGTPLSLEGKANRLAAMLRSNLGLAMQGLAVVPLFAGIGDGPRTAAPATQPGRIFSFDVTGGKYEEVDHHAIGSGSGPARSTLKRLWRPGLTTEDGVRIALECLTDAADDDAATGGPDVVRGIAPLIRVVDTDGERQVPEPTVLAAASALVEARMRDERGEEAP